MCAFHSYCCSAKITVLSSCREDGCTRAYVYIYIYIYVFVFLVFFSSTPRAAFKKYFKVKAAARRYFNIYIYIYISMLVAHLNVFKRLLKSCKSIFSKYVLSLQRLLKKCQLCTIHGVKAPGSRSLLCPNQSIVE